MNVIELFTTFWGFWAGLVAGIVVGYWFGATNVLNQFVKKIWNKGL